MHPPRPSRAGACVLAAGLLLAGCGGGDAAQQATEAATSPATTEDLAMKPEFDVASDQAPPDDLEVVDLVEGDGDVAEEGDEVTVHYVGKSWSTGEEFDASWNSGQPFTFTLGEGRVIQGWDRGVEGMKVGGRRKLVIPPGLAYGEAGYPPVIAANETLVFVVDLLQVR